MSIAVLLLPPTRHQVTERKRVTREPGLHRSRRHDARNRWHPTDFWIIIITGWLLRAALITQGLAGEAAGEFSVVDGRLSVDEQVADAGQGLMHDQFACWVSLASWSESHARRSTALLVDLPQHPQEASRMLDVNEAEVESILDGFKLLEDPRSTVNRSGRSARDSRCHSAGSSNPEGPPAAASAAKGLAIAGPETGDGARGASAVTWTRTGASGGPPASHSIWPTRRTHGYDLPLPRATEPGSRSPRGAARTSVCPATGASFSAPRATPFIGSVAGRFLDRNDTIQPAAAKTACHQDRPDQNGDVLRRGCEKMGLAPSENRGNREKWVVAKVPVPIFSQPRIAKHFLEYEIDGWFDS
jgi:hypothetical protein